MSSKDDLDIAVIGMAGRFPGARTLEEFWQNLAGGIESISTLSDDEIRESGVPASYLSNPNYVKAAPVLDAPGDFDAGFFGFSPMEAMTMDPQHRLLLELAHEALENAGHADDDIAKRVGVFAGSALNTYFTDVGLNRRIAEDYIPTLIGNDKDFLSTRVSYKLNLKGPSITVQTACSTSAVAVHLACQSLLSGETDMALAGAVSVRVPHRAGYFYDGGGVVSPDAHVRAFDARANGTVFGSGGGVLVLKRLSEAIADGDTVRAVIKGSAVNNDGSAKAGYTAPSVDSQADAVVEALANAGIDADSISYIEAHGSGTPVGDPIEVRALTKAFRASTGRSGYCAIGSVKTNVGHLDAAAAVAGLIKTVLALEHRQLPPSLHFEEPNPEIDFAVSPFYVNTALREWKSDGPRRAGVMSTGMGGTNAHIVLEEAPEQQVSAPAPAPHLLALSAKTGTALNEATNRLREFLEIPDSPRLADVAYTLQLGRKAFAHRRAVVCVDRHDAVEALADSKRAVSGRTTGSRRPILLLLPGIGDHYVGMGHDLYESWPVFREAVDLCAQSLRPHLGLDIRDVVYPPGRAWKQAVPGKGIDLRKMLGRSADGPEDNDTRTLNQTRFAQPALFTIEWAMTRLWQSLGIAPDAIAGHSLGEYVAACTAGVMSLDDALRLVAVRARLVSELPQGAMLAVTLGEDELVSVLPKDLSISLINGPSLCVVAGLPESVAAFEQFLNERGVICRHVQNAHAFHSRMLDPIAGRFEQEVRSVRLSEPTLPFLSNVTGTWITGRDATSPSYWARHATQTARFGAGLRELWRFTDPVLLEAGPGRTLGVLAMQHPDRMSGGDPVVVPSLRHDYEHQSDLEFVWNAIGQLWVSGIPITWDGAHTGRRRRVALPTYPFERQRYWLAPVRQVEASQRPSASVHKNPNPSEWLYVPSWKRLLPKTVAANQAERRIRSAGPWLVFENESDFVSPLTGTLASSGGDVVVVRVGTRFQQLDRRTFTVEPGNPQHYDALIQALQACQSVPSRIVHAWSSGADDGRLGAEGFARALARGFYSLVYLSRALAAQNVRDDIQLSVISSGVQDVSGADELRPEAATLLGPCMVIRQEYPNIHTKSIDIDSRSASVLLGELIEPGDHMFVALRNGQRWVQTYERVTPDSTAQASVFRSRGVYLITGGLGEIGIAISRHLAQKHAARLVLVGRSPLPARDEWSDPTGDRQTDDRVTAKVAAIQSIEQLGAEVVYLAADVADAQAMQDVVDETYRRFGALHGVIHAAGTVGDAGYRELKNTDPATCAEQFKAKARGAAVLEEILDGRPLDFCLLLSSLASVLGGVGQAAYASANIFMDSFAQKHNRTSSTPWLSVNWDVWRIDDRAGFASGLGATLKELGMSRAEAMAMMETTLALRTASQLVVSTGDLDARIEQWIRLRSLDRSPAAAADSPRALRPSGPETETEHPPRSETERQIAHIWQDALGAPRVGIYDTFAELGGHSLLAVRMVAELRKVFRIDLPIRALFDAPTIAELARYIDGDSTRMLAPQPRAIVPLQPRGSRIPIFGVAGHNGDVFCYQFLAQHLGEDQPLYGLEPPGLDGASQPLTRVEDLAEYFAKQIRQFRSNEPCIIAGFCAGGTIAFELAQRLQQAGTPVSFLAMFGAPYPGIYRPGALRRYLLRQRIKARGEWMASHLRALTSSPVTEWGKYMTATAHRRKARLEANQRASSDQVLVQRAAVERATLEAAGRYTPVPFAGRVMLFVPGRPWARSSGAQPLRWRSIAKDVEEYFGPDECDSDVMLLEPHVATFAEFVRQATKAGH